MIIVDAEGNTFEHLHIFLGWVAEFNIVYFKSSIDFTFDLLSSSAIYLRNVLHELNNLVRSANDCSNIAKDHGDHSKVEYEHEHVEHECRDLTNRNLVVLVEDRRDINHSCHGSIEHQLSHESEQSLEESLLATSLIYNFVTSAELRYLSCLIAEGLDCADIRERLLSHRVHFALLRLNLPLQCAHPVLVEPREDD